MREILFRYLRAFCKVYPNHPPTEIFDVYERALADTSDLDLAAACETCLRECTFFPVPAEILKRVKLPDFMATVNQGNCPFCGGTGWKVAEKDGRRFGVLCDCTKKAKAASG